jgi:hypothetical protein
LKQSAVIGPTPGTVMNFRTCASQISQGPNGEVRVRLHDKHAALVSIDKHH